MYPRIDTYSIKICTYTFINVSVNRDMYLILKYTLIHIINQAKRVGESEGESKKGGGRGIEQEKEKKKWRE